MASSARWLRTTWPLLGLLTLPFLSGGAQNPPGWLVPDSTLGRIMLALEANVWNGRETLTLLSSAERGHSCADVIEADRRDSADVTFLERWHYPARPPCDLDFAAPTILTLSLTTPVRTLLVRHLGAEDRWRIAIGVDAIHISAIGRSRVSLMRDTLVWRTRRNTLRVSCGANDVAQWYCVELYRALAEVPGIHAVVVPRVGRLPLDLPAGTGDTRYERNRIYRYDDDRSVERAKAALRSVASTWGGDAVMQLWTSARWAASDTSVGPR
jgi:hypothetical protein